MARTASSVLVVDDDRVALDLYANALRPRTVHTTDNVLDAVRIARTDAIDLALVDLRLEDQPPASALGIEGHQGRHPANGLDLVAVLRRSHPDMTIAVISGGLTWAYSLEARRVGADGCLSKHLDVSQMISIIERGELRQFDTPPSSPMSLDRAMYEYVTQTFIAEGRNITRTARILRISRNKLKRKLRDNTPER
jgi:ActR/RegA family two-component response regulator